MRAAPALGRTTAALAVVALALLATPARAEGEPPEALFQRGADALARGEYGTAIDALESLADSGFAHPDASFDRGLAYVARVRAKAEHPGDLGRAAAGFEEALLLRPGDGEADAALDLVRAEVTRRRSRHAKDAVDVRPTLDRVVVGLASEQAWELAAIAASLLFALGLVLRRRPTGPVHVAGSVLAPTAALVVLMTTPLAWGARELRLETGPGVVVAPEVFLTDEAGTTLGGDPIPEAATVEVDTRKRGERIHVRWGASEGWVPTGTVRVLAAE
jgi:hypothetical protein